MKSPPLNGFASTNALKTFRASSMEVSGESNLSVMPASSSENRSVAVKMLCRGPPARLPDNQASGDCGAMKWMTCRTEGLSMPMPKAFVATMTRKLPGNPDMY